MNSKDNQFPPLTPASVFRPGDRLGPYLISGLIGRGGMGEVYRAKDTRLGRPVAVKILSVSSSSNPEHLKRFEQEARAAAALEHPNILAVHDVGTHAGMPYIVTELLEGETLRQRLGDGRLLLRQALEIARQVAEALSVAHEKGIIHRDLKPENLFLTRQNRVKILDFGLAKLLPGIPESWATPDESAPESLTVEGSIIGTPGYMAPEQVRGEQTDHRTDIFAFGAILYEMVSGKMAFGGQTTVEQICAVLRQNPVPLPEIVPEIPPSLDLLVNHCLEKIPGNRFQSARDLNFALASIAVGDLKTAPTARHFARPSRSIRWRTYLARGLAASLLLALGLGAGRYLFRKDFQPSYQRLTFRRGPIQTGRLARDGRTVVYSAAWDGRPFSLYTTRTENPESFAELLPEAGLFALSDKGELAACLRLTSGLGFQSTGTLARLSLAGGAARELQEQVSGADWQPGSDELAIIRQQGNFSRLEFPVGKRLYQASGWISHLRFSPAGDRLAFIEHPVAADDTGRVVIMDLAGKRTVLTPDYSSLQGLAWHPRTGEIWFSPIAGVGGHRIVAVTASGKMRLVTPMPIQSTLLDIGSSGELLLALQSTRRGMAGLVPPGPPERDLSWLDWSFSWDLSADGKLLLFEEQYQGAGASLNDVYIRDTGGAPAVRLGEGLVAYSLASDGRQVLAGDLARKTLVFLPVGAGQTRRIPLRGLESVIWALRTAGGRHAVLLGRRPGAGYQIFRLDLKGGQWVAITPEGIGLPVSASADGEWILVEDAKGRSSRYEVASGKRVEFPEIPVGYRAVAWSGDEGSVLLSRVGSVPGEVYRFDLSTRQLSLWRHLMPADPSGITSILGIRATPDFAWYVYSYRRTYSELCIARGIE